MRDGRYQKQSAPDQPGRRRFLFLTRVGLAPITHKAQQEQEQVDEVEIER
jgi:hypothetical protein